MKHTADPNPINAIKQEVEKAKRAPKKRGIFSVKKANDWIKDSRERPDPRTFFHGLIVEYECTVIFASSGVGKSIYVTQIAEDIAWLISALHIARQSNIVIAFQCYYPEAVKQGVEFQSFYESQSLKGFIAAIHIIAEKD